MRQIVYLLSGNSTQPPILDRQIDRFIGKMRDEVEDIIWTASFNQSPHVSKRSLHPGGIQAIGRFASHISLVDASDSTSALPSCSVRILRNASLRRACLKARRPPERASKIASSATQPLCVRVSNARTIKRFCICNRARRPKSSAGSGLDAKNRALQIRTHGIARSASPEGFATCIRSCAGR